MPAPPARLFEGGCLCGAVRYRATHAPLRAVLCHCAMCRKQSGAPLLGFVHFPAHAFQWVRGAPAWYRSSEYAQRGFCARCGSALLMQEDVLADRVQVTVGSLDEAHRVRPDDHVWTQERLPWFDVSDTLPRFARSSPAAPTSASQD